MRFMIIRRADEETEAGVMPSQELLDAMTRYNEELVKAGVMLDGAGLRPTSKGSRVRFADGRTAVVDGPFTEAKELIAGYTMIQAKSLDEAIEWVKRWPPLDGHGEVTLEIRQVGETADYDMSDELREREQRLQDQLRGK